MTKFGNKILLILFSLLLSCDTEASSRRSAGKDIVIGIVHSSSSSNFFAEGVSIAVNEINENGGLLGKKIRTIVRDDMDDPEIGEEIATELAENNEVIAVVGHRSSVIAKAAAIIYQNAGILFLAYGSKDPKLTQFGGELILRNIPTYKEFAHHLAQFVLVKGARKILVFSERSPSQILFADFFKKEAGNFGIEIAATRSYFPSEKDFKKVIAEVKSKYDFDSVFVAGYLPTAGELVKQLRDMGVNVPIIGGDSMDSPDLWSIAGKAADRLAVPTVFNPGDPNKRTRDFVRRFESKYGFTPDTWSAQGYDAISLLAHGMEKSSSTVPQVIASTIRFLNIHKGVTGSYSFTPDGDITGKKIFFKAMRNGEYDFLDVKKDYESDLFDYIEDYTLRLPLEGSATTIDPAFAADSISIEITGQLFAGLTTLDPKTYEAVPHIAKNWDVAPDGMRVTFHLRNDIRWTNGEPVTAHDVVWAIRRNIDPETKSAVADTLNPIKNAQAIKKGIIKDVSLIGVSAPDAFTVVFDLEYPAPYFLPMSGMPAYYPLPRTVIEKYKELWTDPDNILTNGPYRLVSWQKDTGIFMKKNPVYHDVKNVRIPEVRYFVIPQSSVGLAMYRNNELDIMGSSYLRIPFKDLSGIRQNPLSKEEYSRQPQFCTYGYAFNTKLKPVDNPLVRKAISAAIDRRRLIEAVTQGDEEPASTLSTPPVIGSVNPEENVGVEFDPVRARKWLAEAGYPYGRGFPEITILYNKSETHEKIAVAIRTFLQHYLDIPVKLEEKEFDDYFTDVFEKSPAHIFRAGICADYADADSWMSYFHPSKSSFRTGFEDSEFAGVLDKASAESDPARRKAFYKRAEQILCEEAAVVIPLYYETAHCMTRPRIKGWYHMPVGGQHIRNWHIEKEKR